MTELRDSEFTRQLDPDEAVLLLVDHQVGIVAGVRDYSIADLKHNPGPSSAPAGAR